MGRHKRIYPVGRLRLVYPKEFNSDKEYTLYYEYTWGKETIRRDTGLRVRVEDWNHTAQQLRTSFRMSTLHNNQLTDTLHKFDAELMKYAEKYPNRMCAAVIHSVLFDEGLTRDDEGLDFSQYVLTVLEAKLLRGKISKSRYENGCSGMNIFREFLQNQNLGTYKKDAIYLSEITPELLDKYIKYRREIKKNKDATINHSLTPILQACKAAKDNRYISSELCAQIQECRIIEKPDLESDTFDGEYLTKKDLNKLVKFYCKDKEERRKEYIEMWLFSFHTCGLRLVDILTLRWSHIDLTKRELRKIQVKTAKNRLPRHVVPLSDASIQILNRWKEKTGNHKYVFGLVDDDFDLNDQNLIYYRRNAVDRTINQSLKVVGTIIGLRFPLTFHKARHTFAINALNDGMSLSVLSRLLGHSSTDVTEKVYAAYLPKTLADEVAKLNYHFLPD